MLFDNQVPSEAIHSCDIYSLWLLTAQQQKKKGVSMKIKDTELFRRCCVNISNKLGSKSANWANLECGNDCSQTWTFQCQRLALWPDSSLLFIP